MNLKEIGLRIKNQRQIQGLTQKQLAEKIGTTWEMISRYETGKSSPLGRIDLIAEALNVEISEFLQDSVKSSQTLKDAAASAYSRNVVPLIEQSFKKLTSAIHKSKDFYVAPDWIIQRYKQPFAIKTENLDIKTTRIKKSGILFAVRGDKSNSELVIAKDKNNYVVTAQENTSSTSKIVATILAWEQRFV